MRYYFYRGRYYRPQELYEIACKEYGCDIILRSFRHRLQRYSTEDAVSGNIANKPKIIIKECSYCNEEFEATRVSTKYCSYYCRDRHKSKTARVGRCGNEDWFELKYDIEPLTEPLKPQSIRLICFAVIEDAKRDLEQNRDLRLKEDAIKFFKHDLDDWLDPFSESTRHVIRRKAKMLLEKEEKPATRRRQAFHNGTLKVN